MLYFLHSASGSFLWHIQKKQKRFDDALLRKKMESRVGAYAMWNHGEQLCSAHGGRTRGPQRTSEERIQVSRKTTIISLPNGGTVTRYKPQRETKQPACKCDAYPFPHRPAGGGVNGLMNRFSRHSGSGTRIHSVSGGLLWR